MLAAAAVCSESVIFHSRSPMPRENMLTIISMSLYCCSASEAVRQCHTLAGSSVLFYTANDSCLSVAGSDDDRADIVRLSEVNCPPRIHIRPVSARLTINSEICRRHQRSVGLTELHASSVPGWLHAGVLGLAEEEFSAIESLLL